MGRKRKQALHSNTSIIVIIRLLTVLAILSTLTSFFLWSYLDKFLNVRQTFLFRPHRTYISLSNTSFEAAHQPQLSSNTTQSQELFRNTVSPVEPFRARHAPITPNAHLLGRPIRIRVLLFERKGHAAELIFRKGPTGGISDEILNIAMDGFERSPYFELVNATIVPDFHEKPDFVLEEDEDIVWVIDERRRVYNVSYTIPAQLYKLAQDTLEYQQRRATADPTFHIPSLKVVFMDYRDHYFEVTCTKGVEDLIGLLGADNVRSVRRTLVKGRHWDEKKKFVQPGKVHVNLKDAACLQRPILQSAYAVRSDYAQAVLETYRNFLPLLSLKRTPADTIRTIDVAHFWPLRKKNAHSARLRQEVTNVVLSLPKQQPFRNLTVIGDFVSLAGEQGRFKMNEAYTQALLTTKIVVVAQRDEWEDAYRFFEAMVGGGLVLTDVFLMMPEGLVAGEHVIVYHSLDDLKEKILYYLDHEEERKRIARAGWEVALKRHCTYHRMEELFFGSPLSP